jgi:CTP:molybdopterin cytidylyltransferase MocA
MQAFPGDGSDDHKGGGRGVGVAGLVLAAGAGRRYGGPKALDFLGQAVGVLRDAGCDPLIVVLGAGVAQVRETVDLTGLLVVDNPDWAEGMGSSLRRGLTAAAGLDAVTAVCVHLVDMPGVTPPAVARLLDLAEPGRLARACYQGVPGHPVLLGREHWAAIIETVTGDQGARAYLRDHAADVVAVECGDVAEGYDVDVR